MAAFDPRKSLRLWQGRLKFRRRRHRTWVNRERRRRAAGRPELARRAHEHRARWAKLVEEAERMVERRQRQVRGTKRQRSDRRWGGSRYFTNRINDIVQRRHPGTRVTSRKRPVLLGNLGSDHNLFNRDADAIDHALVDDHATKNAISRELGGPAELPDFGTFEAVNPQNGKTYRIQLIAGTHGTGPHHHSGVKLA